MKLLTVCLLLLCSGSVMAEKEQKTYLCIPEAIGGVVYDINKNSWKNDSKSKGRTKFIIKVNDKDYPKYAASVTPFGKDVPIYICPDTKAGELLSCASNINDLTGEFHFDMKALRFIASMHINNPDDTPSLLASVLGGDCSPL